MRRDSHAQDVALVRRILDGDLAAWGAFIESYAGLIYSVLWQNLHSGDQDDIQSVFVDVLASLRRAKLRTYQGRARLSTWLTVVTRSEVADYLRRRFGRGLRAKVLDKLSSSERTLFRLFYLEGWPPAEIVAALTTDDDAWTLDRCILALCQIEDKLGPRRLLRLSYDLHAQSTGAASGRLLEYLDHVRDEQRLNAGAMNPEYQLMEHEAMRTLDRLRTAIAELGPVERTVLEMRFERGWSARRIASELGLVNPRGVYSMLKRIVRRLRDRILAEGGRER